MRLDANAVLWSSSAKDRAGRPLLVLLHGLGSHEGDLFSLGAYLPLEPVLASLRAPIDLGGGANSWFPLQLPLDPEGEFLDPEDVDRAADAVLAWLGDVGHDGPVGLVGFSQGGATALQLLRRDPGRFAFAVVLSGFVAPSIDEPADARLAERRPDVFWGRGTLDTVIPPRAVAATAAWLPAHSTLDARVYEDVAHGVSQEELADVSRFIRAGFARALSS
ncbi:dienelactone hydrolase family protein [Microbacteriaceae bacterium VKM Ac-2855]|nr:dienelactone hydrolase family protein [Microbacteriaceae bacterium VKM Ac-2855]